MTLFTEDLKKRLVQSTGLTESVIETAWPEWWTAEAETSPSAKNELRFSIARKLGLDPRSLSIDQSPRFIWDGSQAKYKTFSGDTNSELPAITSFGTSVGRMLLSAVDTTKQAILHSHTAQEIRQSILKSQRHVGLIELMSLAWGLGIPVIHLRTYPLAAKRMCAMAVNVGGRHAILLARDAQYPAPLAFHLAHEIGHIALGHLAESQAIVDMGDYSDNPEAEDPEENQADRFALELLTGSPAPQILPSGRGKNSHQLASECLRVSSQYRIEPGTLALCYGYSTKQWSIANRALDYIYNQKLDAWKIINAHANKELTWGNLTDDNENYIRAIIGGIR